MNTLKNTILSTKEAKAKLDHTVKQIFSNRQILARIIKRDRAGICRHPLKRHRGNVH